MNKQRILRLLQILIRESDMDKKLSISDLISRLEEEGFEHINRKTLYDDIRALEILGLTVEYDNGYYLSEAPFSLSEIKIIVDSLNSLKSLDDSFLAKVKEKLYSFLSGNEEASLRKLEYRSRHRDARFINRLEDALQAIINERGLSITRRNKDEDEEIFPLFLHRVNDYYYLYYHYPGSSKIYHVRFDNIRRMDLSDKKDGTRIPSSKILSYIEESSSSFHSAKSQTVKFRICDDSPYLRSLLEDDFPNLVFTKDGFSARVSVSNAFFSRLTAYGDKIKIDDPSIADQYIAYLEQIITRNTTD